MKINTDIKIQKMNEKLAKMIEQKKKIDQQIKLIKSKINDMKKLEQHKLMTKLVNNPEALKSLMEKSIISENEYSLLISNDNSFEKENNNHE